MAEANEGKKTAVTKKPVKRTKKFMKELYATINEAFPSGFVLIGREGDGIGSMASYHGFEEGMFLLMVAARRMLNDYEELELGCGQAVEKINVPLAEIAKHVSGKKAKDA